MEHSASSQFSRYLSKGFFFMEAQPAKIRKFGTADSAYSHIFLIAWNIRPPF